VPLQYKNNIFWISKNVISRNCTKMDGGMQNMSLLFNLNEISICGIHVFLSAIVDQETSV